MAKIAWGKPRIFVKNADEVGASWKELPTPAEDTTELSAEKGDKLEAKIEGGENEDVKYKRSTYTLAFNIRKAKDRPAPFPSTDGVVSDHYAVMVQPEDPTVEGFSIDSCTVSVDETFNAADGAMWNITMEALKAKSGDTVKWGLVSVSSSGVPTFEEGSSNEAVTYNAVASPAGNPKTKGYWEKSGDGADAVYRQTWDETVLSGKTYYTKS